MAVTQAAPPRVAMRLHLQGRVQGLGVRPAVARLANRLGLAGSVRNTLHGLEIEIEGEPPDVAAFQSQLSAALPRACEIRGRHSELMPESSRDRFTIERDQSDGPLLAQVPSDAAVCDQCLSEANDASDRRFGYPLISCAACGPRYSVIRRMPYERSDTTLADFPLCAPCRAEYTAPADRRFHAQTTACSRCGPHVWAVDRSGQTIGERERAMSAALAALRTGRIVALRGVGGYQLLCDASNATAVARLRDRKSRPAKPLAVLVRTAVDAAQLAELNDVERRALVDPANPIVLLRSRRSTSLAAAIHPGLDNVGAMLPTTALHDMVVRDFGGPLVCTSGNREGDPLEYEPVSAERNLAGIADLWLHHDRPIKRPIDDSVVRVIAGRPVTIRLARGMAPLSLDLPAGEPMIAFGGHQKAAAAWCNGAQCVLGPHVGDLETLAARERFTAQQRASEELYRFAPEACVHDLHPDYYTSRLAQESGLPTIGVQHHFAHVVAGMLEQGLLDETVLGVAFDGTGLGTDGTIWGGEFILARGAASMQRVARLRPFVLPGGEAAIREPWRVAASVLADVVGREALLNNRVAGVDRQRVATLLPLLDRRRLNVITTSAGRLFDAAACLILSLTEARFDGEPAMRLEAAADRSAHGQYPLPVTADDPPQLDWRPLFAALWADCRNRTDAAVMAMRFHRGLSAGMAAVIRRYADLPVVLGGGVFQNRLLTELLVEELDGTPRLRLPGRIPPNDGGLAAGQLAIALAGMQDRH
jgi:hydrogenase maturation protein HypF